MSDTSRVDLSSEDGRSWSIKINGDEVSGITVGFELEASVGNTPRLTLTLVPKEFRVKLDGAVIALG